MKAFLAAALFYCLVIVGAAVAYETLSLSSSEAYSRESARVGHDNPVDGRLGWSPDL